MLLGLLIQDALYGDVSGWILVKLVSELVNAGHRWGLSCMLGPWKYPCSVMVVWTPICAEVTSGS
jgi:hypothetical protein